MSKSPKSLFFGLAVLTILKTMIQPLSAQQAEGRSTLTLINHSGENALVKLIGPAKKIVAVNNGENQTVSLRKGTYQIYVRYGQNNNYRYARGQPFTIEENALMYTKASLTLHGVINGNYSMLPISREVFEQQ